MRRIWILVLALSLGLNVGLLYRVLAPGTEPSGPGVGSGRPKPPIDLEASLENHLDRMTEHLGLDDEQRAAIQAVHEVQLPQILAQQRVAADLRGEVAATPSQSPLFASRLFFVCGSGIALTISSLLSARVAAQSFDGRSRWPGARG